MTLPPGAVRVARLVATAVIIAIGIFNVWMAVTNWTLSDAGAYWEAALRLRAGQELYPALASVDASEVYRYSPWFAWAAVPWTFLSVGVAGAVWSAVLLVASALALIPLVRSGAWLLVALFAPILVGISAVGNVHPLIVAAMVWGVGGRGGPVAIGLAASLKIFPLLFALVYAGRREWTRFALALIVTALLWAPALLYDLSEYAVEAGRAASLYAVPLLYVAVAGAAIGATLALARSRWGWLAAATTVIITLPRLFVYDVTYLMVGADSSRAESRFARSIE